MKEKPLYEKIIDPIMTPKDVGLCLPVRDVKTAVKKAKEDIDKKIETIYYDGIGEKDKLKEKINAVWKEIFGDEE